MDEMDEQTEPEPSMMEEDVQMSNEEADVLTALSSLLDGITATPLSRSLHASHLALCQSTPALASQLATAREMYTDLLAVPENVWLPILDEKTTTTSIAELADVVALDSLFVRAETDYFSIQILKRHATFLLAVAEIVLSDDNEGMEIEGYDEDSLREKLREIVSKAEGDLSNGGEVWEMWMRWEEGLVDRIEGESKEKGARVTELNEEFLKRLQTPHSSNDATFSTYSTFVSTYMPPAVYEETLVKASSLRQAGVRAYSLRADYEVALVSGPAAFDAYIRWEKNPKKMDSERVRCLYERALADSALRRTAGGPEGEAAAKWEGLFWTGLLGFLAEHAPSEELEMETLARAVRAVPENGEVWAFYIRALERFNHDEQILDVYSGSLATNLLGASDVVEVTLARAAQFKRTLYTQEGVEVDEEAFQSLVTLLKQAIEKVRSLEGADPRLRLEKFLASIYVDLQEPSEDTMGDARKVWAGAIKHYANSYLAWTSYATFLWQDMRDNDKARRVYKEAATRNQLDWPEGIWEAWIEFEHRFGSVEEVEHALARVKALTDKWAVKRQEEAAAYQQAAAQVYAEQLASQPIPVAPALTTTQDFPMEPTAPQSAGAVNGDSGKKRKAEDAGGDGPAKRVRIVEPNEEVEPAKAEPPKAEDVPMKRDRENTSVFVSGLPAGVVEDDLGALFKDCGEIREIKITQLPSELVATVEFMLKDSVPAALTRDKKRINGAEVAVSLAWQSTLYVTNFPEKADDAFIRAEFAKFGTIFDVRWPSKRVKTTRRFCYVQFVSPDSANGALSLEGKELEPGRQLSVAISNPARKKERTDARADKREVFVAGLARHVKKEELEKLFGQKGAVKDVRITLDKDGTCKGFAFVEFEQEAAAEAALALNNYEFKKRRIAVTMSDPRAPSKREQPDTGQGRRADLQNRSVRIRKIPTGTQEAVLQQMLEKLAAVKKVVMKPGDEAIVEMESVADAGKLLLNADRVELNGQNLEVSEEGASTQSGAAPAGPFIPRTAGSRPKAGLGSKRGTGRGAGVTRPAFVAAQNGGTTVAKEAGGSTGGDRSQDDFRKMLSGRK